MPFIDPGDANELKPMLRHPGARFRKLTDHEPAAVPIIGQQCVGAQCLPVEIVNGNGV
jgi:hypothetical protein